MPIFDLNRFGLEDDSRNYENEKGRETVTRQIPIDQIEPLHAPADPNRLARIRRAMTRAGNWKGRPLVVVATANRYRALTGAHRYVAAREIGWPEIPCVVIDGAALALKGIEYEQLQKRCDRKRAELFRQHGFDEAAAEIDKEIAANNEVDRPNEAKGIFEYE